MLFFVTQIMPRCSAYSCMHPEVASWELQFRNYSKLWAPWWILGWELWDESWWMIDCTLGTDSCLQMFNGGKYVKWEVLQDVAIFGVILCRYCFGYFFWLLPSFFIGNFRVLLVTDVNTCIYLQCILIVYFIAITNRAICRTPLHISMGLLVVESVQLCIQV